MAWEKFISAGIRMPFYMNFFIEGLKDEVPRLTNWHPDTWVVLTENQLTSVYHGNEEVDKFQKFLEKNITKRSFLKKFPVFLLTADENLLKFCRKLYFKDYQSINQKTLISLLSNFSSLFRIKFGLYPLARMVDLAVVNLFPMLVKIKISKEDYANLVAVGEISNYSAERINLLKIIQSLRQKDLKDLFEKSNREIVEKLGRFYPSLYYQIETYVREFSWVPVDHHVQPMNLDQAIGAIREAIKDDTTDEELKKLFAVPVLVSKTKKELIKKYKFSQNEIAVIKFMQEMNAFNENRKAAMSKALLWSYALFQAIADFLKTDVISLRQLNSREMTEVLRQKKINKNYAKIISERLEFYTCLLENGKITELNGEEAKEFAKKIFASPKDINELKGMVAQKGKATGKVRLILMEYQVENLKEGEILVASMTDPDMVPAMKRAAAIVTDEGGITCHAAIVSREFGKPCIIGTKIATKIFKDGDVVEVDANKGIVRKI